MLSLQNIHPISDFQRNVKTYIRRLKRNGQPEILTVNGEATLVIVDAASFQKMLQKLDEADAVLGIQRGLASMDRSGGLPAKVAFAALDKKVSTGRRK
jgi:prevent-host-death family protein